MRGVALDDDGAAGSDGMTFDEVEGGTELTLVCTFDKPAHKDAVTARGFKLGTNESFDKLEAHLAAI